MSNDVSKIERKLELHSAPKKFFCNIYTTEMRFGNLKLFISLKSLKDSWWGE